MDKLPGIPEAPQEVEGETSSHPSHPSYCLQGKLSCFFLRQGHIRSNFRPMAFLISEDNLFPSRQRPSVSPPDHERDHWKLRGWQTPGRGTVSGTAGKPGPGSRKGPLPPGEEGGKPSRHHQRPGEVNTGSGHHLGYLIRVGKLAWREDLRAFPSQRQSTGVEATFSVLGESRRP